MAEDNIQEDFYFSIEVSLDSSYELPVRLTHHTNVKTYFLRKNNNKQFKMSSAIVLKYLLKIIKFFSC